MFPDIYLFTGKYTESHRGLIYQIQMTYPWALKERKWDSLACIPFLNFLRTLAVVFSVSSVILI